MIFDACLRACLLACYPQRAHVRERIYDEERNFLAIHNALTCVSENALTTRISFRTTRHHKKAPTYVGALFVASKRALH